MPSNRIAAESKISQMNLTPHCQQVADYWLSIWDGDELPIREKFHPTKLGHLLRNTALFDVVPDQSVRVRLAGTALTLMLGVELTGADWLALVTPDRREARLQSFSAIARGAIGIGSRTVEIGYEQRQTFPELLLPFRASKIDSPTQVLYFADWFPNNPAIKLPSAQQAIGGPVSFTLIMLDAG